MGGRTAVLVVIAALLGVSAYLYFGVGFRGVESGRIVVSKYFCSDVCPENGRYYNVYFGIHSQVQCDEVGGVTIEDPAWGGFIGCGPQ